MQHETQLAPNETAAIGWHDHKGTTAKLALNKKGEVSLLTRERYLAHINIAKEDAVEIILFLEEAFKAEACEVCGRAAGHGSTRNYDGDRIACPEKENA